MDQGQTAPRYRPDLDLGPRLSIPGESRSRATHKQNIAVKGQEGHAEKQLLDADVDRQNCMLHPPTSTDDSFKMERNSHARF